MFQLSYALVDAIGFDMFETAGLYGMNKCMKKAKALNATIADGANMGTKVLHLLPASDGPTANHDTQHTRNWTKELI